MEKGKIIIVDDEQIIREDLCRELIKEGYEATCFPDAISALDTMNETVKVAIVDLRMPKMDGLEFVKTISSKYPKTQVIIITGHGDETDAIQAVKLHVFDYIKKGDLTIDRLLESIETAVLKYKVFPKIVKPDQQLSEWTSEKDDIKNIRAITSEIKESLGDEITKMRG